MNNMRHILDYVLLLGSAGAILYHVVAGYQTDMMLLISVWGMAICGLHVWRNDGADRRKILDMAVVSVPALLLAVVLPVAAITDVIQITPALFTGVVLCSRLGVPYALNGIHATQRVISR